VIRLRKFRTGFRSTFSKKLQFENGNPDFPYQKRDKSRAVLHQGSGFYGSLAGSSKLSPARPLQTPRHSLHRSGVPKHFPPKAVEKHEPRELPCTNPLR